MGLIRVNASELKTKATELKSLNGNFKSAVQKLEDVEGSLNGMWEGETKDAFHKAFNSDKTQMNNFYNAIEQYVARLNEIAKQYENAEKTNTSIANKRSYK